MPNERILLVEDDKDISDILQELLENEGYVISYARNGKEALTRLREEGHPHLILLDLMMPVMDGYQFHSEKQKDPTLSGIPFIVMSAGSRLEEKFPKGTVFLKKPVDINVILQTIRQQL